MSGPPPAAEPALLLMAVGRTIRDQVDARLAEMGVTYRHLSALRHLRREPELSYSELGRRAGVAAQSMQATVRHLEALGAVERQSQGRGRRAQLQVTPAGTRLLKRGTNAVSAVGKQVLAPLTETGLSDLTEALLEVFKASNPPRTAGDD